MTFQFLRMTGQFARMPGHANGIMAPTATIQRIHVSVSGVTWPTIARPITQLSDQKSDVRLRSR